MTKDEIWFGAVGEGHMIGAKGCVDCGTIGSEPGVDAGDHCWGLVSIGDM